MNKVVALQPERQHDLNPAQLDLVRRTVAKDCNPIEFDMFMAVCKRVGLDPFRRQIHCVIYSKDDAAKRQMVLITAIDGLRAVAARAGNYRPDENPPEIITDEAAKNPLTNPRGIVRAVVRPRKMDSEGNWHKISGEAYWEEFAPLIEEVEWIETGEVWQDSGKPKKIKKPTGIFTLDPKNNFWRKMPIIMLSKCAESQALRKGWPEDLAGVYSADEMSQAQAQNASDEVESFQRSERIRMIGGSDAITIQWVAGEDLVPVPVGKFMDKAVEFVKSRQRSVEIEAWKNRNKHGLQMFWAKHKGDALTLKKVIEDKIIKLDK